MKQKILLLIFILTSHAAYAGGWDDFARGFAEQTARNTCEEEYSPAMCAQMEADKREKAAQREQHRQIQWELDQQRQEINSLRQQRR